MSVPQPATRRRSIRRAAVGTAAAIGIASAVAASPGPVDAGAPGPVTVQLLAFNDYHGHVQDNTPGSITGNFGDAAAGGAEFLSAKLTELRAATTADDSLTVAAGDLIGGSPYFSGLFHDEPSVESLNVMGLDVSGVGNHEFDEGVTELIRMQDGGCHPVDGCYFPGDPYAGADFQWLAANVTEDAPDGTDDFEDSIPDYSIEFVGGQKIAFIGMTLEGTDELVAASGIEGFTFEDEVDTANALVPQIKAAEGPIEAFVVLLHEGANPVPFPIDGDGNQIGDGCGTLSGPIVDIAENLDPEIDVVVTGHTHQPYTCTIDDPADNPRSVSSAFSFGRVVTEIELTLDPTGEVDRDSVTAVNHSVLQPADRDDVQPGELAPDPAVTAVISKWQPLADERGLEPVGTITETITRGGDPTGSDRGVESDAGNLVADAQLASTQALATAGDVAFMNPGGLRSDLVFEESGTEGDGVVTFGEAFTFQPFNNTMFVLPMTGEQIVDVLKEQCQPAGSSRPFLHLGVSEGFTYDLATVIEAGDCVAIDVTNVELDGTPLDPMATYNVAVNNFLADGGDNFDTFAEVDPNDRVPGPQDIDALIDYFEANSPVAPPGTDRVNEVPPAVESVVPARLLDTRVGDAFKTVDGEFEGDGAPDAGTEIELVVAGRAGVPEDASAAQLNIGVIRPVTKGFLTVYPCGVDRPLASNVNFPQGGVVSNPVFSQIGDDGKVCIYTSAEAELYADLNGFVPAGGSPTPLVPARLLETRDGPDDKTVDGLFEGDGPIQADTEVELQVAGRGGVPEDSSAVTLNVGAVRPEERGFLTLYPCGEERPLASSVNYAAGTTVSNASNALLDEDGKVCVYSSKTVDVIIDVNAAIPPGGAPTPLVPARLLETRDGPDDKTVDGLFEGEGRVGPDAEVELQVTGRGGVPDEATAVTINVGAVRAAEQGYVTVYPCGEERPLASSINYRGGDVISNSVLAKIGEDGKVCIYTLRETDFIADVTGFVAPVTPVVTMPG
jgi:5'-nucleotidase